MATGAVSSRNVLNSAAQQPAQPILRSGESILTTQASLKDPNAKTYFHMVPGSRFVMPDGLEVRFMGGRFTTNDPAIIRELDAVADKAASQIYTRREAVDVIGAAAKQAAAEAAEGASADV